MIGEDDRTYSSIRMRLDAGATAFHRDDVEYLLGLVRQAMEDADYWVQLSARYSRQWGELDDEIDELRAKAGGSENVATP